MGCVILPGVGEAAWEGVGEVLEGLGESFWAREAGCEGLVETVGEMSAGFVGGGVLDGGGDVGVGVGSDAIGQAQGEEGAAGHPGAEAVGTGGGGEGKDGGADGEGVGGGGGSVVGESVEGEVDLGEGGAMVGPFLPSEEGDSVGRYAVGGEAVEGDLA